MPAPKKLSTNYMIQINTGIKINVTESKREDFSAVGQNNNNPMVLRVDSD